MRRVREHGHLNLDPFEEGFLADTIIDHSPRGAIHEPKVIVDLDLPAELEVEADFQTFIGPAPAPPQIWHKHGLRWEMRDGCYWAILDEGR